jgi:hypothetical protein
LRLFVTKGIIAGNFEQVSEKVKKVCEQAAFSPKIGLRAVRLLNRAQGHSVFFCKHDWHGAARRLIRSCCRGIGCASSGDLCLWI